MNYAARNGLLLSGFDRHAAHPAHTELKKAAERCLAIVQKFSDERDAVLQDRSLTPAGKRTKLEETRAEATRLMGDARAPIDSAVKAVERLDSQLVPVPADRIPSSGIPTADYLKAIAARDEQLNGATQRQRDALQAVVDEASAIAGICHNDLASSY
jgi:hypothetical protein